MLQAHAVTHAHEPSRSIHTLVWTAFTLERRMQQVPCICCRANAAALDLLCFTPLCPVHHLQIMHGFMTARSEALPLSPPPSPAAHTAPPSPFPPQLTPVPAPVPALPTNINPVTGAEARTHTLSAAPAPTPPSAPPHALASGSSSSQTGAPGTQQPSSRPAGATFEELRTVLAGVDPTVMFRLQQALGHELAPATAVAPVTAAPMRSSSLPHAPSSASGTSSGSVTAHAAVTATARDAAAAARHASLALSQLASMASQVAADAVTAANRLTDAADALSALSAAVASDPVAVASSAVPPGSSTGSSTMARDISRQAA